MIRRRKLTVEVAKRSASANHPFGNLNKANITLMHVQATHLAGLHSTRSETATTNRQGIGFAGTLGDVSDRCRTQPETASSRVVVPKNQLLERICTETHRQGPMDTHRDPPRDVPASEPSLRQM